MLRILVPVCLFIFVTGLPYEFAIPRVKNPDLGGKDFEEVPDNVTFPPGRLEFDDLGNPIFVTLAPGAHDDDDEEVKPLAMMKEPLRTFRTLDWPLEKEDLTYAMRFFRINSTLKKWKEFNVRGDWELIDTKDSVDTYKAFAFRRAVIDEHLIQRVTDLRFEQHPKSSFVKINFFDDYQVVTHCNSSKISHSFDKVFVFRGKIHYAKFSYICPRNHQKDVCMMSTIYDAPDSSQGWINEHLASWKDSSFPFYLRTVQGNKAIVQKWRHFWTCETGDFVQKLYPTLPQRLDAVGLTGYDIEYAGNTKVMLALRMFGLELLRDFRRQVPGFEEEMIADLEHQEHLMFKVVDEHPEPGMVIDDGIIEEK